MTTDFDTETVSLDQEGNYWDEEMCSRHDLNCDGTIEPWELMDDAPRVIFGIIGTGHAALWFYTYFGDSYASTYGFSFTNWYTSTRTLVFLLAILFSLTQAISWGLSYVETIPMLLYAFYYLCQINKLFYISAFWLSVLFNIIHIATRTTSTDTTLPALDDDWSESLLFS
jgi:hypothetical protein